MATISFIHFRCESSQITWATAQQQRCVLFSVTWTLLPAYQQGCSPCDFQLSSLFNKHSPSTRPMPSSPGTNFPSGRTPTYRRALIVSMCSACVASVPEHTENQQLHTSSS